MTMFFEWLRVRHPQYLMEQETPPATAAPPASADEDAANATFEALKKRRKEIETRMKDRQLKAQDRSVAWQDNLGYNDEEIIIQKTIIPKDMVLSAQFDYKKWRKDFTDLQQRSPGATNFATFKDLYQEPVRMFVVTDQAFKARGKNEAYYVKDKNSSKTVVLPQSYFETLPTQTTDGELTSAGKNTLARVLRYTTQTKGWDLVNNKGEPSRNFDRWAAQNLVADNDPDQNYRWMSKIETEDQKNPGIKKYIANPSYNKYYQDIREMGVRLAALKNYMSKNSLFKIANLSTSNKFMANKFVDFLPEDEIGILRYVFNNRNWLTEFSNQMAFSSEDSASAKLVLIELINNLKKQNKDIMELLNFYDNLPENEKQIYLGELIGNYDKVVQNKPQYNQNAVT
jgi:hypothetical protein